jgi:hypothetical protein
LAVAEFAGIHAVWTARTPARSATARPATISLHNVDKSGQAGSLPLRSLGQVRRLKPELKQKNPASKEAGFVRMIRAQVE